MYEYIKTFDDLPKIVAVDFDGTLVADRYPDIGEPNIQLINTIKQMRAQGIKVILWTCRNYDKLQEALDFCKTHGLGFDEVNKNIPEVLYLTNGKDTRKVYADIYIDDRAINEHASLLSFLK